MRRRPAGNRTPTQQELEFYLPILLEEIQLVNPDVIVTLGKPLARMRCTRASMCAHVFRLGGVVGA